MGTWRRFFFQSVSPSVGIPSSDLRHRVALFLRDNEEIWRTWRFMEDISACDLVGTCGFYVQGNAEIVATSDFISRHLLILGANADQCCAFTCTT